MKVLVVGAGAMGRQIAMVCALAGHQVTLYDIDEKMLTKGGAELRARMASQVTKGRKSAEEVETAFALMQPSTHLAAGATTADLVIEAAVEKVEVKHQIFEQLSELCPPGALLATNSSSFVPSKIASSTTRPQRFCNLHFFNPALVMRCVEIVRGPETSDETIMEATEFVRGIGKDPVVVEREIHGFIANRLLNAVRDEAIRLFEGGYASVESIDTAARSGLGYPMGPFELMDLTGIDIGYHVKQERYAETRDPADLPSRSVVDLVEAGHLGRKTGRGFYVYDEAGNRVGKEI